MNTSLSFLNVSSHKHMLLCNWIKLSAGSWLSLDETNKKKQTKRTEEISFFVAKHGDLHLSFCCSQVVKHK